MKRSLRGLGPAMPRPAPTEAFRAALGACLGLLVTAAVLASFGTADNAGLIAPFGATAFLVFVVPNSPLAQPWSAVVGNSVSAAIAVLAAHAVPYTVAAAAVAVGGSILAMSAMRALHPPAGAVALLTAVLTDTATPLAPALGFSLYPVALGTLALVGTGVAWNRATGRAYPFRQMPVTGIHGTRDIAADRRLLATPEAVETILTRLRLAPNLGSEDLARAIAEAETGATARHLGKLAVTEIMSRDVVAVAPEAGVIDVGRAFRRHGFNTLPVCAADGSYLGLILDRDLIGTDPDLTAAEIMQPAKTLLPTDGLFRLLPLLADGKQSSVPVLEGRRLVGIVTRSDLIALLARKVTAQEAPS